MEILFLGVGEACDPEHHNTSLLVRPSFNQHFSCMLDCGFTAPHRYFRDYKDPEQLEALWISHFHGDHFFGVPLLLLRFWEMGRCSPLQVLGPAGLTERVESAMELAYPGFRDKLTFPLLFSELKTGIEIEAAGMKWGGALCEHAQNALAVRIDDGSVSLFFSGDGRPTQATEMLAHGCDCVVHEAFRFREETVGHGSVDSSILFAKQAGASLLALVHLQREDRKRYAEEILQVARNETDLQVVVPESGDIVKI